ncbi:MAG TPA: DinB family protein [Candidatus Sulfopaludibacter sp.]|jgi:hypothetical protein|nr:DinB family protein [Candidatus Sulfopaludibacter sp.]
MTTRPDASEHAPYYAKYTSLVPEGDIVQTLVTQLDTTLRILNTVSEEKSLYRYAPGKWSIREAYVHVTDAERVFTYRALRFARADQTPLASMEQDAWVGPSGADARPWQGIVEEYLAVRTATVALFGNLPAEAWTRTGIASGHPVSVRALAYIVAGHDIHHRNLLQQQYLRTESI